MFTAPWREQSKDEITISGIDGATLASVVKCFYTGEIEIDEKNVEALLVAASFLLFPHLEAKCTDFLRQPDLVNESNCLGIWTLARSYAFEDLKEIAFPFVIDNFAELVGNEDFHGMNKSDLMELLENDELVVDSEEDVFNAVVDWVEFDSAKRKTDFADLVRGVRLHLLSSSVSSIHRHSFHKTFYLLTFPFHSLFSSGFSLPVSNLNALNRS